jgi:xanthine dehydrogenase YagT iron-sulfur-binding subunit
MQTQDPDTNCAGGDSQTSDAAFEPAGISRRTLLQSAGGAATLSAAGLQAQTAQDRADPPQHIQASVAARRVNLRINGRAYPLNLEPRVTLLDALREYAGLPGTKKGCDRGQCGACTVLVNGQRINSCLTLAVMQEGSDIRTIEGLGTPESLHPMQVAFIDNDAFQCGYCTPGQICSAVALLSEHRQGQLSAATRDVRASMNVLTDDEIRERMSGNICRCGAYPNIVAAVRSVAQTRGASASTAIPDAQDPDHQAVAGSLT